MNVESSVKKVVKKNNLSLSIAFSVAIHLMMVGGLVYAAMHTEPPKRLDDDGEGMNVMMLDLSEPVTDLVAEPAAEENVLPLVEEQPDIKPEEPEPEVEPKEVEPEPLPDVAQEAKIIIEEPKKTPPPKPKPKKAPPPAVKKEPVKPAGNPVSGNTNNTAPSKTGIGSQSRGKPPNRARPSYPNQARMMGIEGRVVVQFDVDSAGKVVNIQIVSETPKNMFAREVRRAMARWRYEPNKPTKNLSTTFVFNLTGNVEMK